MFREDKIERNEIVKNVLGVKSLEQLSYSIFQDEYLMEDENKANDCLKYLIENLGKVYEYLDNQEDYSMNWVMNNIDLYQIGDIINFLETIEIKKVD